MTGIMNRKRICIFLTMCMLIIAILSDTDFAAEAKSGSWKHNAKGYWYSYADGTYAKNEWLQSKGKWYHFDTKGYMQTGWQQISGKWYYFNKSGAMQTGWQQISGKWYYFNKSGIMQTGWKKIGGKWYLFEGSGVMKTGWHIIYRSDDDFESYHLSDDGSLDTDMFLIENEYGYRLDNTGKMIWSKELEQDAFSFEPERVYYSGDKIILTGFYVNTFPTGQVVYEDGKKVYRAGTSVGGYSNLYLEICDQDENIIAATNVKDQELNLQARKSEYVEFTFEPSDILIRNADLSKGITIGSRFSGDWYTSFSMGYN